MSLFANKQAQIAQKLLTNSHNLLGSSSKKKKWKYGICPKGGEGANPKSKLFGMNFGSIEINLRGWVMGD